MTIITYALTVITTIFLFSFHYGYTNATGNCETLLGYDKYLCQSQKHCKEYKPDHITFQAKEYEKNKANSSENESAYNKSKQIYRDNQNGIYSCSIIKVQKNSLELIKRKLLKIDKSGNLSSTIKRKIDLKINKVKSLSKIKKCRITDKKILYSKREVLTESTYQLCKYSFYLEYTKQYYLDLRNSLNINKDTLEDKNYDITRIVEIQQNIQNNIEKEKNHTYKIFHLAFQSYIDYESNLPVHILLELLKQDFIIYRQKLYQALSPLNQVVYKISNAMSIH